MEEEYYREQKRERLIRLIAGLAIAAVVIAAGFFLFERLLTSMGLQAAPAGFTEEDGEDKTEEEEVIYGHVQAWTGEDVEGKPIVLPEYEITVEDYRLEGLTHVGRPSATQEQLSTDLFIVINDDPGELVLSKMRAEGIDTSGADTMTVLVRDNPESWQTLNFFDPVTVTITVPDALAEAAFVDKLVAYAVYNRQHPDSPGGLAELPVSVSEEDGICYASFLVTEDYETEYALCEDK